MRVGTLKIKTGPQLDEPPWSTGSDFLLRKKAGGHQMEVSVKFPDKEFTKANRMTPGQLISQGEVVPGWGKRRATEEEMFKPQVQKSCVLLLRYRALVLLVLAQVCAPVSALGFGRQFIRDNGKAVSRRAG
jgi:hypothetical protein